MNDEKRAWPSEVFVPMLHYVKGVCSRRLSYRRAAKIAKGVLAAREALNFSMSRNKREEIKNVSLESCVDTEQRQRDSWLL